ncbi:response regulator [Desulfogranum mediterraneum]|uniref:response regulator n=1 Tax=Desulfogranum mediterraneum TaxID=160661 RepID=UPI0004068212|nr:response regulator [Desulfogranum mediterraneum]
MNLRQKIITLLLPFLIPVTAVIYLNYQAQKDAETDFFLKMVSLAVENGAKEINHYLRLKNSSFHLILDDILQTPLDLEEISPDADSYIGGLMKEHQGFSMLILADLQGRIQYFKTATNDVNKYLLPREVTGKSALSAEMLDELTTTFDTWKSGLPFFRQQLHTQQEILTRLTVQGEKNSLRYREIQEKLVTARLLSLHPPIRVFTGGAELAIAAGLPFRSETFIFAVPLVDKDHKLVRFFAGVLDWSVIEDNCYHLKSEIGFGGIPGVGINFRDSLDTIQESRDRREISFPAKDSASRSVTMTYQDEEQNYLISAPVVTAEALNLLNHPSPLDNGSSGYSRDLTEAAESKLANRLTAQIAEENILLHSKRLFKRAITILLLSVIFLLAVIIFLSERIVRPINSIAALAKRISKGTVDERLEVGQNDEIGQLAHTFNLMCDEIQLAQDTLRDKNRELLSAKERYRLLFDNAPIAISVSNRKGEIVEANKAALDVFGYGREELGELQAETFYSNPADRTLILADLEKSNLSRGRESELVKRDGKIMTCRFTSIQMEIDREAFIYTMFEDVTYQKEIEQEKEAIADKLQRAKKMEAIGLMASGVAHDLNNILTGIIGYPELILQTLPAESSLRKPITTIKETGERASSIVADLLTLARAAASVKRPAKLDSLIREYLQSPEKGKLSSSYPSVSVDYSCHWEEATICCSPIHVKKSIMNLVSNGVEAVQQEGQIRITISRIWLNEDEAKDLSLSSGEYALLTVADNGPGIEASQLDHIFEPFYTRKEMGRSGTGLGLTIVWNTIQDHDGAIVVESKGQGTSFKLFFPAVADQVPVEPKEADEIPRGRGEHVLVVDDEDVPRDIAMKFLEKTGYRVMAVSSGEEAIAHVRKNQVDLVVLDMIMAPGMNGYQTYRELIRLNAAQRAIIASGFSESSDVKGALNLGASGLVKKPYSMSELCTGVRDALHSGRD